jgi:hypothetical protein
MANEKKPSIYQDRGTIGSAKELDEYGVWVKSEPQILSTEEAEKEADDFSLDGLDDLPDFSAALDSSLDAESPAGADSFADSDAGSVDSDSADTTPEDADFSLPEDDFNLDDFDLGSLQEGGTEGLDASAGDSALDFSIDDEEVPGESQDLSPEEEPGDLDLSLPEEELGPELSLIDEDIDSSLPEGETIPAEEGLAGEEEQAAGPDDAGAGTEEPDTDEGFDEMSLEDLLGDVADEVPGGAGPDSAEEPDTDEGFDEMSMEDLIKVDEGGEDSPGPAGESRGTSSGADMSTQLLMKIADELSSIRTELSALKQEFTTIRGSAEHTESRGFFDDSGDDDKIALTGDELNNILNTADFTEETGLDATGEDLSPDFSEGESPDSTGGEGVPPEAAADLPAEIDLNDSDDVAVPAEEAPGIELGGEFDLSNELTNELELPDDLAGDAALDDAGQPDELGLLDEGALPDELELSGEDGGAGTEAPVEAEAPSEEGPDPFDPEGLGEELSLVDLSDDQIAADFSTGEADPLAELELPGEEDGEAAETGEETLAGGVEITLEDLAGTEELPELSGDSGPDSSFDAFTEEESIALEGFDEDALDLTGAVIDEPDLGTEIQENPLLEPAPADIAVLEDTLEGETVLEEPAEALEAVEAIEEPSLEILDEPGPADFSLDDFDDLTLPEEPAEASSPIDEIEIPEPSSLDAIEDEAEISRAEESAAEIPAVRGNIARGEDLDQIIPEGFVVEEPEDETDFGGAGLDTLDEGISLDEIPEDILPEEDELPPPALEAVEEPEVSALPGNFKQELKQVLSYMDQLLESLPEEKIEEFAKSEYFDTYKKLFKELGLV